MGIERFFNSLINTNTITNNTTDNVTASHHIMYEKIQPEYFYIDFNSILYKIATEIEDDLNYLLYVIIYGTEGTDQHKITTISDRWNVNIKNMSINKFKEYFTEELIDVKSVELVKDQIYYMIDKLINSSNIKKLMISMDGVPNMGKLLEQRKRRYNTYIISKIKKELYKQNIDQLNPKRKKFEENRYGYNRNKILAWHDFMQKVSTSLMDDEFLENLKQKYPTLESFLFSGSNVPGEGEKKIMEDVLANSNSNKGTYIIYSPDSDVVILSMILANKLPTSSFYMLHYEQNKKEYTCVSINILIDNIYANIVKKITKTLPNKINVINDLSLLFTMFGNDFLPKIESIDVRNDFGIIINKYCEILCDKEKYEYIIDSTDTIYKLNYSVLRNFIDKMSKIEVNLLKDTYMSHNYSNYKRLKELLKVNNLYLWVTEYTKSANNMFNDIYESIKNINNILFTAKKQNKTDNEITDIFNTIVEEIITELYGRSDKEFISDFILIESRKDTMSKITEKNREQLFRTKLRHYFKLEITGTNAYCKIFIKPKFNLMPFDEDISSKYHTEQINKLKVTPNMELTKYDRDNYAFERMLGKFKKQLNAVNNTIGLTEVTVTEVTNTKKYYEIVNTNSKSKKKADDEDYINYYNIYFDDTPSSNKITQICKEYIGGLFWVFDFYFNKNNAEQNFNYVSTWFYKHHRPPLFRELAKYMNSNNSYKAMTKIYNDIQVQITKRENFLNSREQYYYITPRNSLINNPVPKQLKDVLEDSRYTHVFPDLDVIVKQIVNSSVNSSELITDLVALDNNLQIDCSTASYLNKCVLHVENISFAEFMPLVTPLRKYYTIMPPDKNGLLIKFDNIVHHNVNEQKGGTTLTTELLMTIKNMYKHLYLETNEPINKLIYKQAKKRLEEYLLQDATS